MQTHMSRMVLFIAVVALMVAGGMVYWGSQAALGSSDSSVAKTDETRTSSENDSGFVPVQQKQPQELGVPSPPPLKVGTGKSLARGRTGGSGSLNFTIKNKTQDFVDDLHVEVVRPRNFRIRNVEVKGLAGQFPQVFPEMSPVEDDDGNENLREWAGDAAAGTTLGKDGKQALQIEFEDEDGNDVPGRNIREIQVWWTLNSNPVADFSPDLVGPMGALKIKDLIDVDTIPTFAPDGTTGEFPCPDITIGETFGGRFEKGSFVLRPDQGFRFVMTDETDVIAVDETGELVPAGRFSSNNLRIDSRGNFVFEVSRALDDELHVAAIIRDLKLETDYTLTSGLEVRARALGAAMGGLSTDDLQGMTASDPYHLLYVE